MGHVYVVLGKMGGFGGETVRQGGLGGGDPMRFQLRISAFVREPYFLLKVHMRLKSRVLH
jgi:hypothetical protein